LLGNSQGAPFALAAAAAHVGEALALVSPADEVAHPAVHRLLPENARRFADLVNEQPAEAIKVLAQFDAERMMTMVLEGSPDSDRKVYGRASFARQYREALEEGFRHGSDGYVRDTVLAMRPWGIDLASIRTPVDIWFGAEDRSHSPDLGATLAGRIRGSRRHVVDGIGGALLWERPRQILEGLLGR
jgi:pimeloyl-ACP methyl ester carboxylesterase